QPYVKNWQLMLCPDRSDVTAKSLAKSNLPAAVYPRQLGYGYNDGWVSDSGYGLTMTQTKDAQGQTLRAGRSIASIATPAACVGFGDTYDTPGYSIAMDNIISTLPDGYSTKSLRHSGGNFNYAFVDGHAKLIHMQSGEYSGFGLTARPASETDALKWCYDLNA